MEKLSVTWWILGLGLLVGCGSDDGGGGGGSGGAGTGGSGATGGGGTGGSTGGAGGVAGSATGGSAGSATGGAAGSTGGAAGTGATGGSAGAAAWGCFEASDSCSCSNVPGRGGAPTCGTTYPCCYTLVSGQWTQCQCQNFTGSTCDIAVNAAGGTKVSSCPP